MMRAATAITLLCALLLVAPATGDFYAKALLRSPTTTKTFEADVYQQLLGGEFRLRIDICYAGTGANKQCESLVQRFNREVNGGANTISSMMLLTLPFAFTQKCCQHDALGDTPEPTLSGTVGEIIPIERSDNYTYVELTSIENITVADLTAAIDNKWDEAEAICPLRCAMEADVVFNIDNSGSISPESFLAMMRFIQRFMDAFVISPLKTNVAFVTFTGIHRRSHTAINGLAGYDNDQYWMAAYECPWQDDDALGEYYFENAVTFSNWTTDCNWTKGSTYPSKPYYVQWNTTGMEQTFDRGRAYVETPFLTNKISVQNFITKMGDGETRHALGHYYTSIGTGMVLSSRMFYRNLNRPVSAEGQSNGYERLLITLADGGNNRGMEVVDAFAIATQVPNVTLVAVAIGDEINYGEMFNAASNNDTDLYSVKSFDDADFDAILYPMVSGSCLGESEAIATCDAKCSQTNGLCTACGQCITCLTNDDCGACESCTSNGCVLNVAGSVSLCSAETECHAIACDPDATTRAEMCVAEKSVLLTNAKEAECLEQGTDKFSFDRDTCICTTLEGDGDGSIAAGAIAGGAVAAAVAIMLVLLLLAALLLLLLLAAIVVIVAVVIAAVVMLAFGISMAIPPSITALEVTAPNQVVNEENPLAVDQMEWVESAAQD